MMAFNSSIKFNLHIKHLFSSQFNNIKHALNNDDLKIKIV